MVTRCAGIGRGMAGTEKNDCNRQDMVGSPPASLLAASAVRGVLHLVLEHTNTAAARIEPAGLAVNLFEQVKRHFTQILFVETVRRSNVSTRKSVKFSKFPNVVSARECEQLRYSSF